MTAPVDVYVNNPDVSANVYDDVPIITKIELGTYVVPASADAKAYIQGINDGTIVEHKDINLLGYISSEQYVSQGTTTHLDPYVSLGD